MNKLFVAVAAIAIIALTVIAGFTFLNDYSNEKNLEQVMLADVPFGYSTLLYVAKNQSFFENNGLNVTFQNFPTGVPSLKALSNGQVDVALSTEYPIVCQAFNNANMSIITTFDKYVATDIAARKDSGILNPSDLTGKKIGLTQGTVTEFYLGRYLNLNNLNLQDVQLVDLPINELVGALVEGTIDAAVLPTVALRNQAQASLGNNLLRFPIQSGQPTFLLLSCSSDFISTHPQTIDKLLKALYQAEKYTLDNPAKAQLILQECLNLTSNDLIPWLDNDFSLSLDQSLITAMRDEAQWMINNHLTNQTQVPQFTNYVYINGLKDVKPQSVTVIK